MRFLHADVYSDNEEVIALVELAGLRRSEWFAQRLSVVRARAEQQSASAGDACA